MSIRHDHLYVEGCDTVSIAQQFGTPLFVVSEKHLRHNLRTYQQTFSKHWPDGRVKIIPSIKASPLLALRRILTEEGAGCDVFGPGELEAAIRGKVSPELISVNGSIKDQAIIHKAIDIGATIVLDSPRELELCRSEATKLGKTAKIMLRIKPYMQELDDFSDYVPDKKINTLTQLIKYGIPASELFSMAKRVLEIDNVDVIGVHAHMGRHSKRTTVWQSWIRNYTKLIKELCQIMPTWLPKELNIGGGFPSLPDKDTDVTIAGYDGPSLDELASVISATLRASLQENDIDPSGITLALEPGRGIHCDTSVHLSRICNLKHETQNVPHKWAEIDTSQMFLGVGGANFDKPKFDFLIANKAEQANTSVTDIVGKTCNLEILYYQVDVPELAEGDIIALQNTGSYIETCAQNFNALPRPGVVLVNGDKSEWIKRAETIDDVFARDVIPERFK
ncbi:alanine racemase [Colwelliaceae bacterium 6441]